MNCTAAGLHADRIASYDIAWHRRFVWDGKVTERRPNTRTTEGGKGTLQWCTPQPPPSPLCEISLSFVVPPTVFLPHDTTTNDPIRSLGGVLNTSIRKGLAMCIYLHHYICMYIYPARKESRKKMQININKCHTVLKLDGIKVKRLDPRSENEIVRKTD